MALPSSETDDDVDDDDQDNDNEGEDEDDENNEDSFAISLGGIDDSLAHQGCDSSSDSGDPREGNGAGMGRRGGAVICRGRRRGGRRRRRSSSDDDSDDLNSFDKCVSDDDSDDLNSFDKCADEHYDDHVDAEASKAVFRWKLIVLFMLLLATIFVSFVCYWYTYAAEEEEFELQFAGTSEKIIDTFQSVF
jgi:hypothetical protein